MSTKLEIGQIWERCRPKYEDRHNEGISNWNNIATFLLKNIVDNESHWLVLKDTSQIDIRPGQLTIFTANITAFNHWRWASIQDINYYGKVCEDCDQYYEEAKLNCYSLIHMRCWQCELKYYT